MAEAESLLNAFVPHLMITDYRLPGNQDGFSGHCRHSLPGQDTKYRSVLITGDVTREVSMAAQAGWECVG